MKFNLGQVVMTQGVASTFSQGDVLKALARHSESDWGEIDAQDKMMNNRALKNNDRLLSAYKVNGKKIWVITEADRSYTTVLLPEEY